MTTLKMAALELWQSISEVVLVHTTNASKQIIGKTDAYGSPIWGPLNMVRIEAKYLPIRNKPFGGKLVTSIKLLNQHQIYINTNSIWIGNIRQNNTKCPTVLFELKKTL